MQVYWQPQQAGHVITTGRQKDKTYLPPGMYLISILLPSPVHCYRYNVIQGKTPLFFEQFRLFKLIISLSVW
jgi:hypothetical protein